MLYKELDNDSNRIRVNRTVRLEDAPQSNCKNYAKDKSFGNCLEKDVQDTLIPLLGCIPLWFPSGNFKSCDRKLNLSLTTQEELLSLFADVHLDNVDAFSCALPCESISIWSELVMEDKATDNNYISIRLIQNLEEVITNISFDFLHGLLPAIGGDIGLTRNVLWIFLLFTTLLDVLVQKRKFDIKMSRINV